MLKVVHSAQAVQGPPLKKQKQIGNLYPCRHLEPLLPPLSILYLIIAVGLWPLFDQKWAVQH